MKRTFATRNSINRRHFLQFAGAGALCAAAPHLAAFRKREWTPLGPLGAAKNISFGFALNPRLLANDAHYAEIVAREATIVTPENAMKWEGLHPARDHYTFEQADAIVAFAQAHKIQVRGHTFCWHRALPPWVQRETSPTAAEAILREHIATVAGRYKGKIHSWDVVNEAIQLRDEKPDGMRNSFWYQTLGPKYIDIAFEAAHAADPNAILTYNDYGLEYENHTDAAKRNAVLDFLKGMKKRGVPIGALGMQSHLRAGTNEHFSEDLPGFLKEVRNLGLKIFITELDVDDSHFTGDDWNRDDLVGDTYRRYLDIVLESANAPVVITWGVWDIPRATGAEAVSGPKAQRPLLFDSTGLPKRDAFDVGDAFRHAPMQQK